MSLLICRNCSDIGQCCRYIELPLARPLTADEKSWVELHPGVTLKGDSVIHLDIKCNALTEEGMCSLYGTEDRPAMCEVWPDHPEQVPAGCAYVSVFDASDASPEPTKGILQSQER